MVSTEPPLTREFRSSIIHLGFQIRKRYPLVPSPEELAEQYKLEIMYIRFETESFTAATSQTDYLQKLYQKVSTVESLSTICSILRSNLARDFGTQEGSSITMEMGRNIISAPLNTVLSTGSVNDSFKLVNGIGTSHLKSTATSSMKKSRFEANHVHLEEIREINKHWRRAPESSEATTMDSTEPPLTKEFRSSIIHLGFQIRKRYPLVPSPEELAEQYKLEIMYIRFETESFTAATSQTDYLQKLYLKVSTVESLSTICSILRSNLARDFGTQEGSSITMEMGRNIISAPLNTVLSTGSVNDSFKLVNGIETSHLKSTATSSMKKSRFEANHVHLEEIRGINKHWRRAPESSEATTMDSTEPPLTKEFRSSIIHLGFQIRKRYPLVPSPEELAEQYKLEIMYIRFETESFTAATSQTDYLQKLYLKVSTVESLSMICSILRSNLARNFGTQERSSITMEMGRTIVSAPLNTVLSTGSVNDSFKLVNGIETSHLKSTATSSMKKSRFEANHVHLEEIREINEHLVDTVVEITDEYNSPNIFIAGVKTSEATIVKCSFDLGTLSLPQHVSAHTPVMALWLLLPPDYPNSSPIPFLNLEFCNECEHLSRQAWWRFRERFQELPMPLSLGGFVTTWECCAQVAVADLMSSEDGSSEDCISYVGSS